MANWTVNDYTNQQNNGDNVDDGDIPVYIDLTITPNMGYVISASQFQIGGSSTESPTGTFTGGNMDAEIHHVVFTDTTTAGAVGNNVRARVHFADAASGNISGPGGANWAMSTADKNIYLDIV